MKGPSPKQKEILLLINDHLARHKTVPSLEEMGEELGITPQTVFFHVKAMKKKGLLTRTCKARSIEVNAKAKRCKALNAVPLEIYPLFRRSDGGKTFFAVKLDETEDIAVVRKTDGTGTIRCGDTFECGKEFFTAEKADGFLHLRNTGKDCCGNHPSGSVVGFFTFASSTEKRS